MRLILLQLSFSGEQATYITHSVKKYKLCLLSTVTIITLNVLIFLTISR